MESAMWYGNHWIFGMHLPWWIFLIASIAIGVVVLVRQQNRSPAPPAQRFEPTPLQLLERRYAAGEISTDEFEERKAHLTGRHT
jgi:putative membrane protein